MVLKQRPALDVVVSEAVATTSASTGWLVVVSDGRAVVTAMYESAPETLGSTVALEGARGFALATGQPSALMPSPGDASNHGIGGYQGVPPSLLVAPGGEGRVVLEVAAKAGGGAFTFDDIEALSSYAAIAEAILAGSADAPGPDATPPARLGAELAALAATDPARYREVATVIELLLGSDR